MGNKSTGPGWISYSPDGQTIVAVIVREIGGERPEYKHQLRVWNAATRKDGFTAELGTSRSRHLDDRTGIVCLREYDSHRRAISVRSQADRCGQVTTTHETGGPVDHTVWSVADLQESFYLSREPLRFGMPVELFYQSSGNNRNEFDGWGGIGMRRGRYNGQQVIEQTTIQPPRPGLQTDNIAMNLGRTHIAVAFRDDSAASKPRHSLVLHEIKTVEEFALIPVAEATNPHAAPISAITFARNGKTLATGGEDGSVALWDTDFVGSTWKPRANVEGVAHHRVYALTFSRDWSLLAAVTWDKSSPNLLLIDGDTGKLLKVVRLERELASCRF